MATKKSATPAAEEPAAKPAAKKTAAKPAPVKTGTAVAVKKNANIVSIQEALKAQAAQMSERTAPPTGSKIQLKGKKFTLPNGDQNPGPLDVVIVDFGSFNAFYEGAFDPNNIQAPICFALGQNPKTMVPSDNAPEKQSDTCRECPMNAFGSAGNGKACKNTRRLAVLPPDADEGDPIWVLDVSPTGIKGFDSYVQAVTREFQMPPIGVVTEVAFDENADYPKLVFGNPRPNENLAAHYGRQAEAADMLLAEPDLTPRESKPAARPRPTARPAAKTAARPARR